MKTKHSLKKETSDDTLAFLKRSLFTLKDYNSIYNFQWKDFLYHFGHIFPSIIIKKTPLKKSFQPEDKQE